MSFLRASNGLNEIMRPRVLFLNRSYWPDTEATGQLLTDLAEDLAGRFDVHILAGRPNHVAGIDYAPARVEQRNGVTIHRTRHSHFPKTSKIGKLANLMSFTAAAYLRQRRKIRPNVVVAQTDPFFLPLVASRMKRRSGCRMIVTLQDIYPDVMVGVGLLREGKTTRIIRNLLQRAYHRADRIVVLSRDMRQKCLDWGLPDEKLTIIPNWADTKLIQPEKERNEFRRRLGLENSFVVMYSGNLGYAHLLEPLLAAAKQLQSRPEIRFVLIGEGVQKPGLERLAAEHQLSNVQFLPYQAREELSQSLSAADVHFVSMHPSVADCLMPSKLYGILASGTPLIAACPTSSELAEIVVDLEVGLVCDAGTPDQPTGNTQIARELADSIAALADEPQRTRTMGIAARELAVQKFDRRLQTNLFAQMLHEVLAGDVQSAEADTAVISASDTQPLHRPPRRRTQTDPSRSDPFLPVPS